MSIRDTAPAEFTGRRLALIMIAFFAVIIAVNVTMAMIARSSWTGLVVKNSYVASQEFNEKVAEARAMKARGWTSDLSYADNSIRYSLADQAGRALDLRVATITVRSPSTDRHDQTVALAVSGGQAQGPITIGDGGWIVEVTARTADGLDWHETRRIRMLNGRLQ